MSKDVIGDFLTMVRNANNVGFKEVKVPVSRIIEQILKVLLSEGYVSSIEKLQDEGKKFSHFKVGLKYAPNGDKVINELTRISKPGRRIYLPKGKIPRVKNGFGTVILTTPKGIMSGREARMQNVGGEVICRVS